VLVPPGADLRGDVELDQFLKHPLGHTADEFEPDCTHGMLTATVQDQRRRPRLPITGAEAVSFIEVAGRLPGTTFFETGLVDVADELGGRRLVEVVGEAHQLVREPHDRVLHHGQPEIVVWKTGVAGMKSRAIG
jgi:hypothetical protein